jgi:hypothetical protein
MRGPSIIFLFLLAGLFPVMGQAAGAACVMAKFRGQTLDYELVVTQGHVSQAQDEAIARLRKKGYGDYYKHLDVIHPQNLTNLPHAYAVVIRSDFKDARGKDRSVVGCGFSARSYEGALWDALRDAQSYFWGWKPDRDGFKVIRRLRY